MRFLQFILKFNLYNTLAAIYFVVFFSFDVSIAGAIQKGNIENIINAGLPQAYDSSFKQLIDDSNKSVVIIASALPALPLDFRSPDHLRNIMLREDFRAYTEMESIVGHFVFSWSCKVPGNTRNNGTLGFTGEGSNQIKKMLFANWGLTSFVGVATDGHVQGSNTLQNDLSQDSSYGELSKGHEVTSEQVKRKWDSYSKDQRHLKSLNSNNLITAFTVSDQECWGMLENIKKYLVNPTAMTHFGLALDPEKFEGAGCGSFTVNFLRNLNFFSPIVPHLIRKLEFPRRLFGFQDVPLPEKMILPLSVSSFLQTGEKKSIDLIDLFTTTWQASKNEPKFTLRLVDPEMLILWQRVLITSALDQSDFEDIEFINQEKEKFSSVLTNRGFRAKVIKKINYKSVLEDSFVKINEGYDSKAQQIVNIARSQALKSKKLKYTRVLNFPAVFIEN